MDNGGRRKLFLFVGWGALVLSVLVPLTVSLSSWLETRDLHCSSDFSYTFAPLLVTCGERSAATVIFGWTLTSVTIGGLALAAVIAVVLAIQAVARLSATESAASWVFAAAVAAVLLAVFGILAIGPDGGRNAWILYTSAASALVLILCGIAGSAIVVAVRRNRR